MNVNGAEFLEPDEVRIRTGLKPINPDSCKACGRKIRIQIFIGGDWCSDDCRKKLGKDIK